MILSAGRHEYISFTPSDVTGLPSNIQAGQTYTAHMGRDLTIKGVTRATTSPYS